MLTVVALTLIALGGTVVLLNWWTVYASYAYKRFHSSVPLLGAIMLGVGMAIVPRSRHYAWAAIFVDYGTLIFLISLPRTGTPNRK